MRRAWAWLCALCEALGRHEAQAPVEHESNAEGPWGFLG